jgi:hypothetical protein
MEGYKPFAVTVQGGSHIKSGAVCQDASYFFDGPDKTNPIAEEDDDNVKEAKEARLANVSIAVVADGHGDSSCFRSDMGSKYAVTCATRGIQQFVYQHENLFKKEKTFPSHRELEKLIRDKLIRQTVASWNMLVMRHYQKTPFTEKELEGVSEKYRERYNPEYKGGKHINHAYGTSLIAAAITPWYWFAYHIGDGRFTVLYEDSSGGQPVPWDSKCFLNVTTSICHEDILDRGEEGARAYLSLHSEKVPPVAFFCCSDGIDDNYPADEKENAECLYRLYREIAVTAAEDGYISVFGQDGKSGQLKDLANGFATKGKGDDTSLAGIVNIEKLKAATPSWKEKMAADEAERKKAEAEAKAKIKAEAEERAEAEAKKAARRAEIAAQIKAEDEAKAAAKAGQSPYQATDGSPQGLPTPPQGDTGEDETQNSGKNVDIKV